MNGVSCRGDIIYSDEDCDLESIKEYIIPKLLQKKFATAATTPDGRTILRNVKPQVEISRKFCPDVRRTASYPDITKYSGDASETELKLQKQCIVNTELKRLLIASVGDNLANKLERLAREKAQLNEQVNILAKQTASDAEKIENLSIQGDIWKSKFLAARVVVNELTIWKDSVTSKLHDSQTSLQKLEEHSKKICYTLHQADRTLTNTVVDLSSSLTHEDEVLVKLKDASKCIAELLTNHANDMCSIGKQLEDLPAEPALTPNMYTDTLHYDYSEIPDRLCDEACCSHSTVIMEEEEEEKGEERKKKHQKHYAQSYAANCNNGASFVGGCKSCAEREILHL